MIVLKYMFGCFIFAVIMGGAVVLVRLLIKGIWEAYSRLRGYRND